MCDPSTAPSQWRVVTKPNAAKRLQGTFFCSLAFSFSLSIPSDRGPPQQPNYPLISAGEGGIIVLSAAPACPASQLVLDWCFLRHLRNRGLLKGPLNC